MTWSVCKFAFILCLVASVIACRQANTDLQVVKWEECEPGGEAEAASLSLAEPELTFYGLVLPVLKSDSSKFKFDCVSCHPRYEQFDVVSKDSEITQIIESLREENGRSFMPKVGERVPDKYRDLLIEWSEGDKAKGKESDYKDLDKIDAALTGGSREGSSASDAESASAERLSTDSVNCI